MAVDEAIAEAAAAGAVPPTLRFYRWNPPTVTLGRHQKLADVDETQIAARGYDLVRRATGGRAILHVDGTNLFRLRANRRTAHGRGRDGRLSAIQQRPAVRSVNTGP